MTIFDFIIIFGCFVIPFFETENALEHEVEEIIEDYDNLIGFLNLYIIIILIFTSVIFFVKMFFSALISMAVMSYFLGTIIAMWLDIEKEYGFLKD